jgi:PPP family 3-phenylpropionic acid transporter
MAALFAAYLAGFGVFLPFFPVWLDWLGLSAGWIAVLIATPLVVRVATTSLVSDAAERFDDPRKPLFGLALATALTFAVIPVSGVLPAFSVIVSNPWALLIVVGVMAIGWNALLPLCDALGIQFSRQTGISYGSVRVWGSIAFIAASFAAGALVDGYGPALIPWLVLAAFGAMVLVTGSLPSSFVQPKAGASGASGVSSPSLVASKSPKMRSGWVFFLRRRGAMSVFIGAGLMQASHAVLYGFGSLSWAAQGFSETAIGLLWSFGVLCEIVLFAVSAPIIARLGARGLLIIGGIGATLRWAIFAFSPDLAFTAALQILHAFSFGMTHLALISYIARRARPRELRGAQGVYGVVSGAIMAIATLVSGPLYAALGPGAYVAMAVMTALGAAIIIVNRVRIPGASTNPTA